VLGEREIYQPLSKQARDLFFVEVTGSVLFGLGGANESKVGSRLMSYARSVTGWLALIELYLEETIKTKSKGAIATNVAAQSKN
jgi:hypothetical protein